MNPFYSDSKIGKFSSRRNSRPGVENSYEALQADRKQLTLPKRFREKITEHAITIFKAIFTFHNSLRIKIVKPNLPTT